MYKHGRILAVPDPESFLGARLEDIRQSRSARRWEVTLDYQAFRPAAPAQLWLENGRPHERVQGVFEPARLRLSGVKSLQLGGLYDRLETVPPDHPARSLRGVLYFRSYEGMRYALLHNGSPEPARFMADVSQMSVQSRPGDPVPAAFTRDWSPPPPARPRLIPNPQNLHALYGGNPVTVHLDGKVHHRRLFIGALDMQSIQRPRVDAVLNLGEEPNPWDLLPEDRWETQGEGSLGMNVVTILRHAGWVAERLLKGQRVLVHCLAGMNRSATVCCAALFLLENLSAEAALERLRQHHPWSRPDSYHWLALRWITRTT